MARLDALRRRLAPVRVRTTLAATAVVAVTLVAAAVVLLLALRASLVRGLETSAELRAADIATLLDGGDLEPGGPIPEPSGEEEAAVAQVLDPGGHVFATSNEIRGRTVAISDLRPGPGLLLTQVVENPPFDDDDDFVMAARQAATGEGTYTIYVAASMEDVNELLGAMRTALVVGVPVVLVLVGLTSWLVVGRALRPVESLRSEVAEISASDAGRRVAEPEVDDEIGRLARTMNGMLDRLESASARQRRFVADASHELQSPLASARAQLEVGLAQAGETDWPGTATDVLEEHERMGRLVRDLLFLAHADEGGPAAPRGPVDLDDIVLSEVARLRSRERVAFDISRVSAGRVRGNHDELTRTVRNLLENAERHAAGSVWVELRGGSEVELVVADDGPGIPPGDRERIFERFTRLDDARAREGGGTGLGLAIAKEVVEAHGGSIAVVESAVGARVAVRLPSADGAQEPAAERVERV
jgi:signal transduction histidine kinase